MSKQNSSPSAIVTGSSRGIGKAIALKLAEDGFSVTVNYARSEKEAAQVVAAIEKGGGKAIAVRADVAKMPEASELFSRTIKAFGGVDVIVNNAGIIDIKPIADMDEAMFDRLIQTNLKGTFNLLHLAANQLRDGGRIINFSTSALIGSMPGYGGYNATKAAVEALTRVLAKELGPRRITVNAVAPGPIATELFFQGKSDDLVQRLKNMIPLGRLGEVEDIAPIVAFLAGPDGGWINGQIIRANGGMG